MQQREFVVKTQSGTIVYLPCKCGAEAQVFVWRDGRLTAYCYRCAVAEKES